MNSTNNKKDDNTVIITIGDTDFVFNKDIRAINKFVNESSNGNDATTSSFNLCSRLVDKDQKDDFINSVMQDGDVNGYLASQIARSLIEAIAGNVSVSLKK